MELTSIHNEKVKYWVKLHEKKFRDEENVFLIEGDHLVNEAIKKGLVKEIISIDNFDNDFPTYKVSKEIMSKISFQKSISNICAVCCKIPEKKLGNKIICLDNIQDPGNLGTIIRSAAAFNFDSIILSDDSVDLYNEKVIRSSEGMIFNINIIRKPLEAILKELKLQGYILYTTDVNGGTKLSEINPVEKYCVILGNEGNGVKKEISLLCDEKIYIKINKTCESLNVGVAASIIMYEFDR